MASVHLLGTGSAQCDPHRTTTMLAMEDAGRVILVDCGGDVYQRALLAGLNPLAMAGLILTHEHPDHVGGFALLMERLMLDGRKDPLPIYGIPAALEQAQRVLGAFNTSGWPLPELVWVPVDLAESASVLDDETWAVTASPGEHGVPVTGLRFVHKATGKVVGYSSDTEPCGSIARMLAGADLIIHEATGATSGHTSVAQAVHIAEEAGAVQLALVHLPRGADDLDLEPYRDSIVEVILGEELDCFEF